MLLAAFIVTISGELSSHDTMQTTYLFVCYHTAWTEKGCKNPSNDPHSDLGDSYKSGLQNWCKTKKASAIFDWFSSSAWHLSAHYLARSLPTFGLVAWSILLILTILAFRREQKANRRELMVLPPASDGISYSNIQPADEEQLDDKSESARGYTPDVYRKTDTTYHHPASARTVHSPPSVDHHPMLSRTSIDVYGAFDGDGMPRIDEPSRTMQLAYTDPCKIFDGMPDNEAHSVTSPFCRCSNPSIPYECVERHPINPHPRHFLRSPSLRRLPTTVMEQFYQMREIKKQMASASHLSFWQKLCTLVGEIATVYHTQIVIVRPGSRLPNTVRLLNFMTVLNDTNFRMLITNTFHQEEACCIWFLSSNPAF